MLRLVKTQMSAAISSERWVISRAERSGSGSSARAAARAKLPPDPMAMIPSSGSISSPDPLKRKAVLQVGHDQQRLQPAENPVAAPVLGQLHRRSRQVARIAIQLLLELFVQGERIGHRAGKPGQHLSALHGAHLVGVRLDDGLADADLAVAAERDPAVFADAQYRRAVELVIAPSFSER